MNQKEIVRLAMDARKNKVQGNFSMDETMHTLHEAFVAANGGKNYLDPRDIRDGKCSEAFAIIEQIVDEIKHDVMTTEPFFMEYVSPKKLLSLAKYHVSLPMVKVCGNLFKFDSTIIKACR